MRAGEDREALLEVGVEEVVAALQAVERAPPPGRMKPRASGNLAPADMYGYLDISEHIHTNPRLMDNFHGYVTRIWISWISTMDIQMDIHRGYPSYPNSHQVDHHRISKVIRSG